MRETWQRWNAWWAALHEENADPIEQVPSRHLRWMIVLASGLGLYFEMLIIRWHATSSHVFAIFKNVSLLSCFLGLGVGYALSSRPRRLSLAAFLPLLAVQALLFGLIATTIGGRRVNPVAEQLVMGLHTRDWSWLHVVEGNVFLAAIFLLNAVMFIPWGYVTGRLMQRLPALESYSLNLLGSLAGIVVFFGLSLVWAPPTVWFGIGLLAAVPFLTGGRRLAAVAVASLAGIVLAQGLLGRLDERRYYSPYQVIALRLPKLEAGPPSPTIKVNSAFYQTMYDLAGDRNHRGTPLEAQALYYNLPYQQTAEAGDVLVVGAGSGNDVAAALRNGARSVTAVEIDPAIVYLGRRMHPERPYRDPRTTVVVTDARTYIRQTDRRFDTIVYGLLDSHTNLGAMTNVRLDSFVYTLEAFQEAMNRLTPQGTILVSYCVIDRSQGDKLYAMLKAADPQGRRPRVLHCDAGLTFIAGPGAGRLQPVPPGVRDLSDEFEARAAGADIPTDDWPYFYMQKRTYPLTYAVMIAILLGLSAWLVRSKLGSLGDWSPRGGTFFFLGMGFMLVETKVITELGLVFGNTWLVSAVAVVGVLLMAYLANRWVLRRGHLSPAVTFPLLGAALLAGLTAGGLASYGGPALGKVLLPALLTAPLFFAGLIFSSALARVRSAGTALSANLFGAIFGGFLEYNSMYWGLKSLYPLGLAVYALAGACLVVDRLRGGQSREAGSPEPASVPKAA